MVDIIIAERTLTVLGVVTHATTLYVWWCWFLLLPILSVHSSLIQWIRLLFSVLIMMSLPTVYHNGWIPRWLLKVVRYYSHGNGWKVLIQV